MDGHYGAARGHAPHPDRRGGIRPLPVRDQGAARYRIEVLPGPQVEFTGDRAQFIRDLEQAVYAAKIISYTQGYMLMQDAARSYNWNLNYGGVALMWREGCIIRSAFLGEIQKAYANNPALANLLLDDYFSEAVIGAQAAWRGTVATGIAHGIPLPIMSGGAGLLRWLPLGELAGESAASAARLLRRAYLRASRSSAGRVFPYQLDGHRRRCHSWSYDA